MNERPLRPTNPLARPADAAQSASDALAASDEAERAMLAARGSPAYDELAEASRRAAENAVRLSIRARWLGGA